MCKIEILCVAFSICSEVTNQNASGRAAGHTVSAVQAAVEIAGGSIEIGGGGLLDLTGAGAIAGVPVQVIGGATIAHGGLTGANTINNIRQDKLLNQKSEETSNGKSASELQSPPTTSKGKLEIEPGRTLSPQEQRIADKLVAEGKHVKAPKEIENQVGERNPDFEVDDIKTELKNVSNIKKTDPDGLSAKLSQRISEATSQGSNVIIDATEQPGMTKDVAELGIKRAFGHWDRLKSSRITNVRIIGKDFDLSQTYTPLMK